jgi:hypothetical protein
MVKGPSRNTTVQKFIICAFGTAVAGVAELYLEARRAIENQIQVCAF